MEWISVKDRLPTGYVWIEEGLAEPEEYIVHVKGAEGLQLQYLMERSL